MAITKRIITPIIIVLAIFPVGCACAASALDPLCAGAALSLAGADEEADVLEGASLFDSEEDAAEEEEPEEAGFLLAEEDAAPAGLLAGVVTVLTPPGVGVVGVVGAVPVPPDELPDELPPAATSP